MNSPNWWSRLAPLAVALALVGTVASCSDDAAAPTTSSSTSSNEIKASEPAPDDGDTGNDDVVLDLEVTVAGFTLQLGTITEPTPGDFEIDATWTNLETDVEAQVQVPTFIEVAGEDPISVVRTNEVVGPQETVEDVLTFSLPGGLSLDEAVLRLGEEDQEAIRLSLSDPDEAEFDAFDPVAIDAPAEASGSTFSYTFDKVELRRDDLFRHEQAPVDARVLLVTMTVTVLDDGIYGADGNILPAEQELVLADGSVVVGDGGVGVPVPFASNLLEGTTATGTIMFIIDGYQRGPVTLHLTADDPAVEVPLELP